MCSVSARTPTCIGHTLEFIIWDVIFFFFVSSLSPTLCRLCPVRCSTPDFWEAAVMARAEPRWVRKGSLAFWSSARLRARRKDLKNQLPEIITFSEEQQVSHSVEPPPVHSPPPLQHSTRHWNHTHRHTELSLLVYSLAFLPAFVAVLSSLRPDTLLRPLPRLWWTMPPSVSWGRGLCAAQAPI